MLKGAPVLFGLMVLQVPLNIFLAWGAVYLPALVVGEVTRGESLANGAWRMGILLLLMLAADTLMLFFTGMSQSGLSRYRYQKIGELDRKSMDCFYQIYEKKENRDLHDRAVWATAQWNGALPVCDLPRRSLKLAENIGCYCLFGSVITIVSPWLAPILTIAPLVNWFCARLYRKWEYANRGKWADIERKLEYVQRMPSDFEAAKDIRIYGLAGWLRETYRGLARERLKWEKRQTWREFLSRIADLVVILLRDGAAYALLIRMTLAGEITVDGFVLDGTPQDILIKGGEVQRLTFWNKRAGTLIIEKLDSVTKKPLSGVQFQLTYADGSYVDADNGHLSSKGLYTTDANGEIRLTGIVGTLVISEVKPLDGYVVDPATQNQTVQVNAADTQYITVYNTPIGGAEIIKVDAADKTKRLGGVTFEIRKMDGGLVQTVTTGSDGRVHVKLDAGDYYVLETEAKSGYKLDPTPHYFTVQDGKTASVTITNEAFSGIILHKINSVTKEGIYGVKFLVYDQNKNPIGEYTTDENGRIVIEGLEPGKTIIAKEIRTLDGYLLDTTPKSIQIKVGDAQTLKFYNTPVGGLELIKVNEADKSQRIPNTTFEIRRMDGGLVDTITTDKQGRAHLDLDAGDYYAVEIEAGKGFELDATPTYFTVRDGKATTVTVTNRAVSGILIHKVDSVTKQGIYGVTFLLYDANKNPIGQYSSDDKGYVHIDDLPGSGRYYLRELENDGYLVDTQLKTVYVTDGTTTEITWENTAITGQIQIAKTSEDYNSMNGWPAGTPIPGTEFEIYHYRTGNLVDTIRTDKNGVAVSKPLPLGRYKVVESKAAEFYGLDKTPIEVEIEHAGQIVKTAMTNKALYTNVSIKKTGYTEVMPGQQIRYDFSGIANNSTTALTSFYWRDTLPTKAVRLDKIVTGTYNVQGNYKIVFKTNLNGEYRTMYDNLSTMQNHVLDASPAALGLASNEYVTEFMVSFGIVPGNFRQVESPKVYCNVVSWLTGGTQFVNQADVGGVYNGQWIMATSRWVTRVYKPAQPLPRTGY